ncbi:FAD-dependent oxidoreductase [Selenomonas sp. TAMA-11512]|uniref:FAD-dependent oxidoreductase n=1 Tax=Selenomonas sp. TAMA-11512 TaxID=3095337 RepID=UPI003088DB7A|nr:FAD-dependent oxidoreductase [Selenomonas sp. TAMA-11512]
MEKEVFDAIVIGGGPAGITAGIYLARANCRVLVLEKDAFGGQIRITSEVVNYPGCESVSGEELAGRMRRQAAAFGAEFQMADVTELRKDGDIHEVVTDRGVFRALGILLATGAKPRTVGFAGEKEFQGRGVAYCATCDGEFFTGKDIFVIGGGYAAAEEAVFLTRYAKHVTILMRGKDFSCAPGTAQEARDHKDIDIVTEAEVMSLTGAGLPEKLIYRNKRTGEEVVYTPADGENFGVFVFAGYEPETKLVEGIVDLDEKGYVIVDNRQATSAEGIYAAGDVCGKVLRQVVTAAGDGATAATELERHVVKMRRKLGIEREKPAAPKKVHAAAPAAAEAAPADGPFTPEMIAQLEMVFSKMARPLKLSLHLDDRPVSEELKGYISELVKLTDKLTMEVADGAAGEELPYVRVLTEDGAAVGQTFHGVPGGHEFQSFVLGLYNMAGPGQPIGDAEKERIEKIDRDIHIELMVSLSCTMCPDLVTAAQRIASLSPHVTVDTYDLAHFPERKDKWQVMSVPCFVVNGGKPGFGKKNIRELLDIIEAQ